MQEPQSETHRPTNEPAPTIAGEVPCANFAAILG